MDQESKILRNDISPTPRPDAEHEELLKVWAKPRGIRRVTAINNDVIGLLYIGAAFAFFLGAGVLAMLMRTQLAVPDNNFVSQDLYNQMFTVHGTTMMFLFAVPAAEALGVILLPQMLAARDLPFPRLSAFAIWAYVIGGTVFFCTIFVDLAPKGGWFMYPPLTTTEYSPGDNADFWLLGIGFIEISAIAGAIELVIGPLRTRPPGMSLDKMPIFGWAMLVFAGMIIFAFPAVILATLLLELERAFGWPFFNADLGGDPLLWQHLFWFFGHPEVYIIFLPAAGLVSMIVPTMCRRPLAGYNLIVVALIGTAFFSFGLWVHHMFATGIPALSLTFFSAVSMAVAIPSGIQVFAWIATIAGAPERIRLTTPALFVFGFLFIFVLGGLTGVMVALVPFDWQVHDTYFVVAHFHYVLVGGMVFPLFATFYYWTPMVSTRPLSERIGRWVFWLMFIGFNVAFLPMHLTGLLGMPRRVWTYPEELNWETLNTISTAGSYILGAGIALFVLDLIRNFRPGEGGEENPWKAGTLEWLPADVYCTRSIPHITSREPIWDQPNLARDVEEGRCYLPNAATGGRETIVTSAIEGRPEQVIPMPGPGWAHFSAAVFVAGFFLLLTIKQVVPAVVCGVLAIASCCVWVWELDKGDKFGMIDIGAGIKVPSYVTGPASHGWWAMVVLMLVAGSLYLAYIFSYLYIWTVSADVWAPFHAVGPPNILWPIASTAGYLVAVACYRRTILSLGPEGRENWLTPVWLAGGLIAMIAAACIELYGHWQTGLRPSESSYGALVYASSFLTGQLVAAVTIMSVYTMARHYTGKLNDIRFATLENTSLLLYYTAGQALLGLLLVHGFPWIAGGQ
jgi:cytochrome c oxidase subunit I+III